MGRACGKVTMKMKQIQNEKVRKSAFDQRNKGLRKKVLEFSKNFGVEACLIVYDRDGDGRPMTWPQDSNTLQSMLTKYEQQKIETPPKEFNVKDYFANKKNMVEAEILSVRKKIVMNKYPTWNRSFNSLGREQLKGFMDIVDLKIQECDQRINMLKNMQQSEQTSFLQNTPQMQSMAQDNVAVPESCQLDDPMNPLVDISEMIDFSDHIKWDDIMLQKNVCSLNSSQLDVSTHLKPLVDINEMIDFSDFIEWDKLDDLVDKSDLTANKLNDGDGWVKRHDVFERKDISFLSDIEQECAALDAFDPQPRYEF